MNYILWKGISSETIRGLLIAELPSITKPQIRTEITEIEGRDGDIVDKIGYYAYDKEVKIGLMPKCDIDEIIEYFSGKGDLVFSNEFDKIYKAEIIDRIDFERVIRLKKAKVKFHVQPFKYKFGEIPTELDVTTETSLMVKNVGLEQSKPIFTLWGSRVVEIQINTFGTFQVDFKTDEYLTVIAKRIEKSSW
jgi:predicted phage tail component-like protein